MARLQGAVGAAGVAPDPGCADLDDDGDGKINANGPGTPDPQCAGAPWRDREIKLGCGLLGVEPVLLLLLLGAPRGRRGRSRKQ